jgi:hypothetical protein
VGGFFFLLLVPPRSDAEQARRRSRAEQMRRRAEPESGRQAAPVTGETLERLVSKPVAPDVAEQAEPVVEVVAYSAEIIDISGRVSDQFYDQYTDAANRAVGD